MEPVDISSPAMALARGLNALGHLASSRAWAAAAERVGEAELRRGVIEAIEEASRLVGSDLLDLGGLGGGRELPSMLKSLVEQASGWDIGAPPDHLRRLARECLEAAGVPEPPTGWDEFAPDDL